ncbi:YfgM family protein [Methylophilus medardicus]|uniref:Tetratricopeptide repeat protein n=1 Tax=Methylophilus medardicus TaxID=2588534 RepID=A0A5B8CRT4_9PROT|nr:tetratricopeptide repeat protein [Methylophilus medardicus]QDC44008.1 tetratricopeptide repeat protein [Methylophilus medardicus]QDC49015.1 tetratricopeptide repeat protein [Methylophilus medardicus]QDC52720.1 tetratricopeptide repeat protein [Methylophilus medardicus]
MAYDLEEQEQLDEFRAWWNKNGKLVTRLVIVAALSYGGWQAYQTWMNSKSTDASTAYQTLISTPLSEVDSKKAEQISTDAQAIAADYSMTPYAGRAALFAARALHEAKQSEAAEKQLRWALTEAKEPAIKHMAAIEIAGLQIERNALDEAKKTLSTIDDKGFDGIKNALLGDILMASKQEKEAKEAYNKALQGLDPEGKLFYLTQQKLDALG